MTLVEMIRKREIRGVATAKVARTATSVTDGQLSPPIASGGTILESGTTPESGVLQENSPATLGPFPIPDGYCPKCGGGNWILPAHGVAWQCGRCAPGPRVERIYVPGGTPPPSPRVTSGTPPENLALEPAVTPDDSPLSPVYWERGDGRILGPAIPEFLGRCGEIFLVVTTFEGWTYCFDADRLRSRKAFEQQAEVLEFEPIL